MECSTPGSSVRGILQASILEWVAMPSSGGSSQPRDWTCVSLCFLHWQAGSLPLVPPGKPSTNYNCYYLCTITGEGNGTPLQYSCLENPMDRGSWSAAVHGVDEGRTRLWDFTFTFHFHALEKEVATHSTVLAWRIPGTGEPGGLPSMGSHRVGHDWCDLAAACTITK